MKRRKFEVFSLSFLDVISCGFGAIVLLLLITKPDFSDIERIVSGSDSLRSFFEVKASNASLKAQIGRAEGNIESTQNKIANLERALAELTKKMQEEKKVGDDLVAANASLESNIVSSAQALSMKSSVQASSKEVGGIPVDADYIIFVVDTSGSMQSIWYRVITVINDIIKIHPKVQGIQILSDMGRPLIPGYRGKWMPDSASMRTRVSQEINHWKTISNSDPTEGIEEAITQYCKPDKKVAIYVFADDFHGSPDAVIKRVDLLASRAHLPKSAFRIHGIVFNTKTGIQTANFLRHLTAEYDGSMITIN